jgi:hypothetical protein
MAGTEPEAWETRAGDMAWSAVPPSAAAFVGGHPQVFGPVPSTMPTVSTVPVVSTMRPGPWAWKCPCIHY